MARRPHVPRLHADIDLQVGKRVALPDEPAHHLLRVLRAVSGDSIYLFNGDGHEYSAVLQVQGKSAHAMVGQATRPARESPLSCTLLQAVSRGDRMETTLRQSVELGVRAIIPVHTRHSAAALPATRAQRKQAHWWQVILGACQQSGRVTLPVLHKAQPLVAALNMPGPAGAHELRVVLVPTATRQFTECLSGTRALRLLIGPESGLDEDEIDLAVAHGFAPVTLGPRVLRTQTAGPAALAIAQALAGDLGGVTAA